MVNLCTVNLCKSYDFHSWASLIRMKTGQRPCHLLHHISKHVSWMRFWFFAKVSNGPACHWLATRGTASGLAANHSAERSPLPQGRIQAPAPGRCSRTPSLVISKCVVNLCQSLNPGMVCGIVIDNDVTFSNAFRHLSELHSSNHGSFDSNLVS